jgi:hypothetical protein
MQVAGQLRAFGQRRCSFPRLARGRLLGEQCLGLPARIQAYGRARRIIKTIPKADNTVRLVSAGLEES